MKLLFYTLLALSPMISFGQHEQIPYTYPDNSPDWIKYMYSENPSLFTLREMYDDYYEGHDFVKNQHTQYFKRLLKHNWLNVDDQGYIVPSKDKKTYNYPVKSPTSPWQEVGPWDYDHEQAIAFEVQSPGATHVYTVEQSALNPDFVCAGTATAGMWMSTDKGLNWTCPTRFLDINGVYSIALDPSNANVIYFGETGGQLWKSTDAGLNWNIIGDATFQGTDKWFRDVKIIGANTLLAATDIGLYRSTDGGNNWTSVHSGEHMEIEINPGNSNIIYTVKENGNKTEFYKSTDNGVTWTIKTAGWPSPSSGDDQKRTEIGVSADDPSIVYVWAAGYVNPNGGLYGFYKSVDSGESFTFECCGGSPGGTPSVTNPNMLGYSEDGTSEGGQYYYDLAFAASPTDANRIFGAGINVWRSLNAGVTWEQNAHWVTWVGANTHDRYSHADVHDVKFFETASGVDMWVASDGGLYYSSDQGDHLEPRMHGIHGTDFWGFGAGFKDGYVMVGGTYHNGTLIRYNDIYKGGLADPTMGGWLAELGGDNYRGFVNFGDPTIAYADNGSFRFSDTRTVRKTGLSFDGSKKCNTSYLTGEYGTYGFLPHNYTTFYSPVGTELYKTTNGGLSFTQIHDFGGEKVIQVKVAWSDPNTIYVTHKVGGGNFQIMRTTDGGATWTNVNPTSAQASGHQNRVKYIEVDDEDASKLWCILIGNQTGNKVFQSNDGGNNWTNITSSNINNENVISISHHYGTNDGLYIGTKKGVYYRNSSLGTWVAFNNNLPTSTACSFLEPFYGENKIRTATQRGVYECEFYETAPPVAMPSANTTALNLAENCLTDTVFFVDHSTVEKSSATYSWYFEGGTPMTSTLENPTVVYSSPGSYDVTLVVTDAYGTDSITIADFMTVTNSYHTPHISEDFSGASFPPLGWKLWDSQGSSWEQDNPEGVPTEQVACYPNYWVDGTGEEHYLIFPALDLTNALTGVLSFDYTYNNNGSYTDSLALVYRTGSNPNWQTLWQVGGDNLVVPGTEVWFWYNTGANISWNTVNYDISALLGESCIEFAFSNIGTNGNHIWVDNVNLFGDYTGVDAIDNTAQVYVKPNPSQGQFTISATEQIRGYRILDLAGKVILTESLNGLHLTHFDLSDQPDGMYMVAIDLEGETQVHRIVKH